MSRTFCLALLSLSLGLAGLLTSSAAILYSTQFDQGYDRRFELAGQQGWLKDTASEGGNGLITNFNNDAHPMHIHVNDFQVTAIDDPNRGRTGVQPWGVDNVNVPAPVFVKPPAPVMSPLRVSWSVTLLANRVLSSASVMTADD